MANNPEILCFTISSQLPQTSVSSGWQRFLAENFLAPMMCNSAHVPHMSLKMLVVANNFLCVTLRCIFPNAHLNHSQLLTFRLSNKSICFPNLFTEPVKWYDYLPGCSVLPSVTMSGYCITCTFLSDCIWNVLNNVAVICGGDEGVVLGSSIVSEGLSSVLEWSVIMCAAVSEVTTSFTHSYSLYNRYS